MRKSIIIEVLFLLILLSSCDTARTKELELKEKELAIRERELNSRQAANTNNPAPIVTPPYSSSPSTPDTKPSKYVYVLFKVDQPVLHHTDSRYMTGIDHLSSSPELNFVDNDSYVYTSQIKEITNYDENKEYQYVDEVESSLRQKLIFNTSFETNVMSRVSDRDEQQKLLENKPKVVDRRAKVFDSYKEASVTRNNKMGKFY